MDPQSQFCHNPDCTARGQLGLGNIRVHSRKERRYRCTTCGQTFAATRDTPFYRLKKSLDLVTIVITLLCHGCPVQAIVAAFAKRERARKTEPALSPLVSVILLTRGDARMTERAVNSVAAQTYPDVELVNAGDSQQTPTRGAGGERIEHASGVANAGARRIRR